jgi:hypothetical protein
METAIRRKTTPSHLSLISPAKVSDAKKSASSAKAAAAKAPKEKKEEPKKTIWQSVFFGLATGALAFIIKILPEKIGTFLSQAFSSIVKADNPFAPEAK